MVSPFISEEQQEIIDNPPVTPSLIPPPEEATEIVPPPVFLGPDVVTVPLPQPVIPVVPRPVPVPVVAPARMRDTSGRFVSPAKTPAAAAPAETKKVLELSEEQLERVRRGQSIVMAPGIVPLRLPSLRRPSTNAIVTALVITLAVGSEIVQKRPDLAQAVGDYFKRLPGFAQIPKPVEDLPGFDRGVRPPEATERRRVDVAPLADRKRVQLPASPPGFLREAPEEIQGLVLQAHAVLVEAQVEQGKTQAEHDADARALLSGAGLLTEEQKRRRQKLSEAERRRAIIREASATLVASQGTGPSNDRNLVAAIAMTFDQPGIGVPSTGPGVDPLAVPTVEPLTQPVTAPETIPITVPSVVPLSVPKVAPEVTQKPLPDPFSVVAADPLTVAVPLPVTTTIPETVPTTATTLLPGVDVPAVPAPAVPAVPAIPTTGTPAIPRTGTPTTTLAPPLGPPPLPPFILPGGRALPPGVFAKRVTWSQGEFQIVADLQSGAVDWIPRTPDGRTPEQTFEVLGFTREIPKRRRFAMGIVTVHYDRSGIRFASSTPNIKKETIKKNRRTPSVRIRGFRR